MTTKWRFAVRRAVAWYLGEDEREIETTRRYQPTRTPCQVYTTGNDYLTATSSRGKRPKTDREWAWSTEPVGVHAMGWAIWERIP
jgi:hypothetical protein